MKPPEDRSLIPAPAEGKSFKGVKWDTEGIEVLRIPADGSPSYKKKTNTIDVNTPLDCDDMDKAKGDAFDIDHGLGHCETDKLPGDALDIYQYHSHDGMIEDETAVSEDWVKHVPNLQKFGKKSVFDWKNRSLVIANIDSHDQDFPEDANGYWCMYKCNEPRAGSRLAGIGRNPYFWDVGQAQAFGDVYVFRLEDIATDRFGRRKYAKTWWVPESHIIRRILVPMACCDGREEIRAEGEESDERSKRVRILLE